MIWQICSMQVSDALRERQQSALDCSTTATVSDAGVESHTSGLTGIPVCFLRAVMDIARVVRLEVALHAAQEVCSGMRYTLSSSDTACHD